MTYTQKITLLHIALHLLGYKANVAIDKRLAKSANPGWMNKRYRKALAVARSPKSIITKVIGSVISIAMAAASEAAETPSIEVTASPELRASWVPWDRFWAQPTWEESEGYLTNWGYTQEEAQQITWQLLIWAGAE
jgi:hypothetical protein